ncbi:MAG: hypothetical protein ABIH20_00660 [Candidatus Diapherotrites archaeon]
MQRVKRTKVRHTEKKPRVIRKYNSSYFGLKKGDFSPSFLAKSAKEQATILAKHEKRTRQTLSRLRKMHEKFESGWGDSRDKKVKFTSAQVESLWEEAQEIFSMLALENGSIFSETYKHGIGFNRGSRAETEFQRDFHDAVNILVQLRHKKVPLQDRLEN